MNKTRLFALVSVFTIFSSYQVQAQQAPLFEVLSCPAIGNEYDLMIAKLDAIRTSIKKDANCANLELKVKSLEDLVTKDRETVLGIVKGSVGQPLTDEQSQVVREYAENVTKKVSALNDLFMQSNYCFRDDQSKDQVAAIAGFVGEASQLVGTLTGPWGAPIAMAGHVIAGFMTGLDAVYKARAGFDFSKPVQWRSYVTNLCTYFSYRDQIQHLLDPGQRLNQLKSLKDRLDTQIAFMEANCDECRVMAQSFDSQKAQGSVALNMIYSQDIERANKTSPKPYGTYMLQSLGLRDWVIQEQVRVTAEAQSYWTDAAGRHLLSQAKENIEDFLINREAPKFLDFGVSQSRSDYGNFQSFVASEGRALFYAFREANADVFQGLPAPGFGWSATPLNYFDLLVLRPIDWTKTGPATEELQYQWTHFRDQGLDRFRNAQASLQVVQTYCSFFRHASLYSSEIRSICVSPLMSHMIEEENSVATKLLNAGIWGAAKPLVDSDDVFLSRIEALTKQIEVRGLGN